MYAGWLSYDSALMSPNQDYQSLHIHWNQGNNHQKHSGLAVLNSFNAIRQQETFATVTKPQMQTPTYLINAHRCSLVSLDPFVIYSLYILMWFKSLRPFSCLLRPIHVYKLVSIEISPNCVTVTLDS